MRKLTPILILAAALALFAGRALALEPPRLEGRVNDYGEMISRKAEGFIERISTELEQSDSTQLVVLTVPSLEGDSLEEFSIRTAEAWGIGQKDSDNGLLLVVARDERKIRLEVGYGLEGVMTDLMAGRIIDYEISPRFARGDFDGGFIAGVQAAADVVKGEYTAPAGRTRGAETPNPLGALLFVLIIAGFVGRAMSRFFGGVVGGVLTPLIGLLVFGLSPLLGLLLLLGGFGAGFFAPLLFSTTRRASHRRSGYYYGGLGGGLGGGMGGFGGGGFGGGGGGFGGGGASGGW